MLSGSTWADMKTILYVSEKTAVALADPGLTADIMAVANEHNIAAGVTGALLSAGPYFSQVLEGPDAAVDEIMAGIRRDPRHRDIVTLREGPATQRHFADWGLAYLGEATYVAGLVAAALREPERAAHGDRLLRFMREFPAKAPATPRPDADRRSIGGLG